MEGYAQVDGKTTFQVDGEPMESSDNPLDELPVLADNIQANTEAEAKVHLMASGFLLQRLFRHKRTRELFFAWMFVTELHKPVEQLRIVTGHLKYLRKSNAPAIQIKVAERQRDRLRQQLHQAMRNINPLHTLILAEHYLNKELHLPWRWLIEGLRHAWVEFLWGRADMESRTWRYDLIVDAPAPKMEHFRFEDIQDESASDRFERFRKETKLFLKEQEAEYKNRRLQKGKASTYNDIERYVDWYFRNKIEGVTSNDIAETDGYDDSYVRERVREVHTWLDRAQ